MMSDFTSFSAMVRRVRAATSDAKRSGGPMIDAMTAQLIRPGSDGDSVHWIPTGRLVSWW